MLGTRSEASGDGPPAAGPDRIVRLATHPTERRLDVHETVDDAHKKAIKKAGALNQALDSLLPELRDDDSVLVMGAGSILAPGFLPETRRRLKDGVGGVGGLQVLPTGTATLFAVGTLRRIVTARAEASS